MGGSPLCQRGEFRLLCGGCRGEGWGAAESQGTWTPKGGQAVSLGHVFTLEESVPHAHTGRGICVAEITPPHSTAKLSWPITASPEGPGAASSSAKSWAGSGG